MPPRLLSVRQVRESTGLSRDAIYDLVRDGRLAPFRPGTRKFWFAEDEVERLIRSSRQPAPVPA